MICVRIWRHNQTQTTKTHAHIYAKKVTYGDRCHLHIGKKLHRIYVGSISDTVLLAAEFEIFVYVLYSTCALFFSLQSVLSESRFPGSWIPWGAWDLLVAFDAGGRHHRKARASRKSIRGGKCEEMRRAFIRNWTDELTQWEKSSFIVPSARGCLNERVQRQIYRKFVAVCGLERWCD